MDKRTEIVEEAKRWLGAKWHHNSCIPYIAADCGQILIDIYDKCGLITRPIVDDYPSDWSLHRDEERYLNTVEKYSHVVASPLPGDIAVWKVGRTFSHGAIVVDWPMIIHADTSEGVVYADASVGQLEARPVVFYSIFDGEI